MASLIKRPNGSKEIRIGSSSKRQTIRLGSVSLKQAQAVQLHVERLVASKLSNAPVPEETSRWLGGVSDVLHERIARVGLVESRVAVTANQIPTLKQCVDAYLARRTDWKPRSVLVYELSTKHLIRIIGDRPIDAITPGMADDFKRVMLTEYAAATTAKAIKVARMIFKDAIRRRLLADNPFADVKPGSMSNPSRLRFIEAATIQAIMDHTPDLEWKALIALSRFGGLRVPSEVLELKWADINFERKQIVVHSPKTEHHAGKESRIVPLFPELEPVLLNLFHRAAPGESHVIQRYRSSSANLRTQFSRIIRSAGFEPWERLWHNLRASRQTELAERFPSHVVAEWLGNSVSVANNHYLQVTSDHFRRATVVEKAPDEAHQNAHHPKHQKAHLSTAAHNGLELNRITETSEITGKSSVGVRPSLSGSVAAVPHQIHPSGLEPETFGSVDRCSIQLS